VEDKMNLFSTNEVIEMAVQIERSGYTFYNHALSKETLAPSTRDLISMLRDQEVKHEQYFLSLRDEKDLFNMDETQDWEMVSAYIKMITDARLFNDEHSAIKLVDQSRSDLEIIDYAITFEKDTLLFFHTLKDKVNGLKTKEVIQNIIQEEITHVFHLTEFKKKMVK
jgi:rubrerythrin